MAADISGEPITAMKAAHYRDMIQPGQGHFTPMPDVTSPALVTVTAGNAEKSVRWNWIEGQRHDLFKGNDGLVQFFLGDH
jgi:hypothetical protein